jgi:hypothetical protein
MLDTFLPICPFYWTMMTLWIYVPPHFPAPDCYIVKWRDQLQLLLHCVMYTYYYLQWCHPVFLNEVFQKHHSFKECPLWLTLFFTYNTWSFLPNHLKLSLEHVSQSQSFSLCLFTYKYIQNSHLQEQTSFLHHVYSTGTHKSHSAQHILKFSKVLTCPCYMAT